MGQHALALVHEILKCLMLSVRHLGVMASAWATLLLAAVQVHPHSRAASSHPHHAARECLFHGENTCFIYNQDCKLMLSAASVGPLTPIRSASWPTSALEQQTLAAQIIDEHTQSQWIHRTREGGPRGMMSTSCKA